MIGLIELGLPLVNLASLVGGGGGGEVEGGRERERERERGARRERGNIKRE